MKNIANFAIAWLLIYQIARWVIGKDAFNIKALLPKVLVSTVLVNMSWFVMGAAIDLSNIGTAAVGAIPQAFFKTNKKSEMEMKSLLATVQDTVRVQLECKNPIVAVNKNQTEGRDYKLDQVWSRFNDMSGPLIFMWMSIFRLQEFNILDEETSTRSDLSLAWIIKIFILIMFLAPIIALFVINLKRVLYLRIIIIFSPLLVIFNDKGLSKMPKVEGKVGWNSINDLLSLKEVVGMIFAPVLTIAGMAITLILTSSMFYVLGGAPKNVTDEKKPVTRVSVPLGQGASIAREAEDTSSFTAPGTNVILQGDLFKDIADFAWGVVWYVILVTMSILLLRWVVGITANTSKIASSTYDGIMKLGKSLVAWAKVIPMWWMGEKVSLWWLAWAPQALMNKYKGKFQDKQTNERQTLARKFWETGVWSLIEKGLGVDFWKLNDIGEGVVTELWNFKGDSISEYLGAIKEKAAEQGKTEITVSSWANLKTLLTKYASNNPNLIKKINSNSTTYGLTDSEKQALRKFNPDQADKLFNITEDLGKAFIKVVSAELTGSALTWTINERSVLFASDSQQKKATPESSNPTDTPDAPETPKASSEWTT